MTDAANPAAVAAAVAAVAAAAADKHPGPSMEQYIETRFNLLDVALGKEVLRVQDNLIAKHEFALQSLHGLQAVCNTRDISMAERFDHIEKVTTLMREASKDASEKTEKAQGAINTAATDWRNAMTEYRRDTVTRPEYERLERDFAAYKLEIAQTVAAQQIRESATHSGSVERRNESRAGITAIIGWAVGAAALASFVFNTGVTPRQQEAAVRSLPSSEKRIDDVIERLNSLSSRLNSLPLTPSK